MSEKNKEAAFEQNLVRLDEIIRAMEKGDISLEDSMRLYEEGAGLAARCEKQLKRAEQQVVKLTKAADGSIAEQPVEGDEHDT